MPAHALGAAVTGGRASITDPTRGQPERPPDGAVLRAAELDRLATLAEDTWSVFTSLGRHSARFTERQIAGLELRLAHARD